MCDEADVWFIDAHAEGDGGDHDEAFFAQEFVLVYFADFGIEFRVVGGMRCSLFL